jgi:two-component system OmpR family response regulator
MANEMPTRADPVRVTAAPPPARRTRVLYVDDYPDVADTAVVLLGLFGFDARAAYDGHTALAAGFGPDVCVLDLNMPGMDGDELAVRLRDQAGGRPLLLVAVTAQDDAASGRRMTAAGFHRRLTKPADPTALVQLLTAGIPRG